MAICLLDFQISYEEIKLLLVVIDKRLTGVTENIIIHTVGTMNIYST